MTKTRLIFFNFKFESMKEIFIFLKIRALRNRNIMDLLYISIVFLNF